MRVEGCWAAVAAVAVAVSAAVAVLLAGMAAGTEQVCEVEVGVWQVAGVAGRGCVLGRGLGPNHGELSVVVLPPFHRRPGVGRRGV